MDDFANLSKFLGKQDSTDEGDADELVGKDSGSQVFNSAAQEAFQALKADNVEDFTEALRTALEAL